MSSVDKMSTVRLMTLFTVFVALALPVGAAAQDTALADRVMAAVREAMAPALPFPASDADGVLPADGKDDPWMVRPLRPGEHAIEVLANPLNEVHQVRAAHAMRQIDLAIGAAQRRAEVQYESAVAEAKRTGQSQDVDGVTLGDEGIAGARIDAESHLTIEVAINEPSYIYRIASGVEPALARQVSVPGAAVIAVAANVYRAQGEDRFCEAETLVLFNVNPPQVRRRDGVYEVTAAAGTSTQPVTSLVVRLRGNDVLMAEVLRKANWNAVGALLR